MVFATDHPAGNKIMQDIYSHAGVNEIPALHSRALAARARERDAARGIEALFEITPEVPPTVFSHEEPWEPHHPIDDDLPLDN